MFGQATKGTWWMPWLREAMKDAASCDMLRVSAEQASIRRFPNGETRQDLNPVTFLQGKEPHAPK